MQIRWWLYLLLVQPCITLAADLPLELRRSPIPKSGAFSGDGMSDAREGGESWDDALVIPSLPFADSGATCDNTNDVDVWLCQGDAPDVVYRYTSPNFQFLNVSLCGSGYDTVLGVYNGNHQLIWCNDDLCEPNAEVDVSVEAGQTYYIVVDGYQTSCGSYVLNVTSPPPCTFECPPDAQLEGEPPCVDDYYDAYNSGCGGGPWTPLYPQTADCLTMCGRSCTYLYHGYSYRDTDWYTGVSLGGPATVTCTAGFPARLVLIYGTSCYNLSYVLATGAPCEPVTLTWDFPPDTNFWIVVEPTVFSGVPESDYAFEACGLREPGACCFASGSCSVCSLEHCENLGGQWLGWGTHCDPDPCGSDPSGACCLAEGVCDIVLESDCAQAGGRFIGAGTDCEPNPCAPTPVKSSSWGRIKSAYR